MRSWHRQGLRSIMEIAMDIINLPKRLERKKRQALSPALQRKKETMIRRFGDRASFLNLFNPDLQMKICRDAQLCFFGDAPVLSELNMAYGEMTATMWLVPQLYNLSEYCGCKDKLQGKALEECAGIIAAEYFYLKVSELMLFFYRFKSGRYGRFYGSVDPLVITTSLMAFIEERNEAIGEREKSEMMEKAKLCLIMDINMKAILEKIK